MNIVTRSIAIKEGLSRYFTGKACKRGHLVERYTRNHKCLDCCKDWYSNNKDKALKYAQESTKNNKDGALAAGRKWKRNNKDKVNCMTRTRQARKLNATPSWANMKYVQLFYKLALIESERTGREVQVDHIYPLQGETVCGLHNEFNLQLLFADDNQRKGNK